MIEDPREETRPRLNRADALCGVLLVLTLIFGAYLRLVGQNWDDFTHLHPDERFMTGVAMSIGNGSLRFGGDEATQSAAMAKCLERYPKTNGVGGYFDAECSDLYPPNTGNGQYVYGELPLFVVRLTAEVWNAVRYDPLNPRLWLGYEGIHFVGRTVSAVADLFTILFIFLATRRLFGKWTGLLAAFLYCCSVLPIQLSHFWTVDAFSNLPLAIGFYFAARVMHRARWVDFFAFGVAFACALSSRINTLPFIGIVILAGIVYGLPALDIRLPWGERMRIMERVAGGIFITLLVTIVFFRLTSPHAFTGPNIWDIKPSANFFGQYATAQEQTSGRWDAPPNYQWVNRTPYLFALRNIILWGLGTPLGLVAWAGFFFALIVIVRARRDWTRVAMPAAWVLVYFALLGKNWVATMRYYMPMYPAFAMLAAWLLVTQVRAAVRYLRERPTVTRRLAQVGAVAALVFVTGFTALWGFGFTRIYTRLLTRGEASQWVLRNLPSAISATITMDDGRTRLMNFPYGGNATSNAASPLVLQQRASVSGTISQITLPHALDTTGSTGDLTTLRLRLIQAEGSVALGEGDVVADFTAKNTSKYGERQTITLDPPIRVNAGESYSVQAISSGNPVALTGTVIATEGDWDDDIPYKVCQIPGAMDLTRDTPSGLSSQICQGTDSWSEGFYKSFRLFLVADDTPEKRQKLYDGLNEADYITISSNRFYDTLPRDPSRFPMTTAFYRELFGQRLGFGVDQIFTSYITLPGGLQVPDQVLPTDNLPVWINEWESEEAFTVYDHPAVFVLKKQAGYTDTALKEVLFGTNINDQSAARVGDFKGDTTLVGRINWPSIDASKAPTAFMLTPQMLAIQQSGGTWAQLFPPDSLLNTSPIAAVLAFYFTLLVVGWATWPLLASLLPALPDKAYPVAKFAGLIIVSWIVWLGGTLRFLTWSAPGILLTLIALSVVSVALGLRNRAALGEFIRTRFRYILAVEGITLALFLAFLLVRLGNPDLWAQALGGEKPMDFSYWNAVLRSTVFPPFDPWYSGGYLNYYYFGYVIVGTPVKLLGIAPQVAYNLVLPMLFAVTGMGAFSVAYNVVAARRQYTREEGDNHPDAAPDERRRWALRLPGANPMVAGFAAMMLCVVLGNLDTPRVMINGIAQAGGYRAASADPYMLLLDDFMTKNGRAPTPDENQRLLQQADSGNLAGISTNTNDFGRLANGLGNGISSVISLGYIPIGPDRWFWGPSRVLGELPNASSEITEFPNFTFIYGDLHAHMIAMPIQLLALLWLLAEILAAGQVRRPRYAAIGSILFGGLLVGILFPTNTWDWITYMALAVVGLTFAAWLRARRSAAVPNGAKPLYPEFTVGGLLRQPLLRWVFEFMRRSVLVGWVATLLLFYAAQQLASEPFRAFFATGFSQIAVFTGNKSPIWAFLDIHGLFLFLLFSLLVWQTARLLRRVYVMDLLRNRAAVLALLAVIFVTAILTLAFSALHFSKPLFIFDPPYPAALIILPMMAWAAVLFFIPSQSREMRVVLAVTILALALTMAAEMVTLANDTGRQNTIFKLYMQVWLLFACAGGVTVAWLLRASERWGGTLRSAWLGFLTLLVVAAALFPIMATQGKIAMRMATNAPHTLDGLAYMDYAVYQHGDTPLPLKDDYAIIRWLQRNVTGSPVILEAQTSEYLLGTRISVATGLPTVLGWRYHQSQQRSLEPMGNLIWNRLSNVAGMYNTPLINTAEAMLRFYNVEYIIVGGLERTLYDKEGLQKFVIMANLGDLEVVYKQPNGDTIYHVKPQAKAFRFDLQAMTTDTSETLSQ